MTTEQGKCVLVAFRVLDHEDAAQRLDAALKIVGCFARGNIEVRALDPVTSDDYEKLWALFGSEAAARLELGSLALAEANDRHLLGLRRSE